MVEQQQQPDSTLVWAPEILENVSNSELDLYFEFCKTACIPGGYCNLEKALDVLYQCHGDIKEATKKLLMRETKETAFWTPEEVQIFEHLFRMKPKNFTAISRDLKTKSVKDCVEFYYLWKNKHKHHQQQPPHHFHCLTQAVIIKHEDQQQPHQILLFPQSNLEQLPNVILQPHQQQEPKQELNPDEENFPCKVCGRVFLKIKSRSAHMKRHKNERLYNLS